MFNSINMLKYINYYRYKIVRIFSKSSEGFRKVNTDLYFLVPAVTIAFLIAG